ncbi:hypothetical protein NLJ89_g9777 [Agrocybe chaxingu]|uniref:Uncharacterized protein n=1 Tax=Agrocybe chaxingu TaxID=84603 RepID=A0A9W8JSX9_9AGAR|nr:hypothetical protein NLJ89_g9777 [Agrocybe chaxingu]
MEREGFDNWSGLKALVIAGILSGFAYGAVVILFLDCLQILLNKPTLSRRRQLVFVAYIAAMFVISTVALVLPFISLINSVGSNSFLDSRVIFGREVSSPYIVAFWGADGMMIWRCISLYEDAPRYIFRPIFYALAGLALFSLGWGGFCLVVRVSFTASFLPAFTVLTNIILASLIASRLLWYQRRIQRMLGKAHGSLYARLIGICVESCLLIVVFNCVFLICYLIPSLSFHRWFWRCCSHKHPIFTQVLSPLLLIRRIAQGKDSITSTKTEDIHLAIEKVDMASPGSENPRRLSPLRFQRSSSTSAA